MATAKATTDHDEIRKWVEARKGRPARVKATGRGKDPGILRIDFPGFSGEDTLEEIEWDEFFDWFDRNNLALLLSTARGNRFNKLVERTNAKTSSKKSSSKKSSSTSSANKAGGSSKKASGSSKKASTSSKKAAASTTKKSSAKKSAASTKKASTSSNKSSAATKKSSAKKSSAKTSSANKSSAKKSSAKKAAAPARRVVAASTSRKTSSKKSTTKKSGASSKTTTNHDEIRQWVESRGGFPATVGGTEGRGESAGLLRIDYPGYSGKDTLERIEWDDWFEKFDAENLAFLYQDKKNSRFSKLVRR